MNRIFRNTIFYLLIFLVIIGVVSFFNGGNQPTDNISYDTFISNLEKGEVTNLSMQPERGVFEVRGQLKGYADDKHFITYIPNSDSEIRRIQDLAGNRNA